jgi:phosphohistidine swiveling domain-containing protein
MKELSQQLWFAFEKLASSMANDLGVTREDFLQMSVPEIVKSYEKNKLAVRKRDFVLRHKGFVVGVLNGRSVLVTGKRMNELSKIFNPKPKKGINLINGMPACQGYFKGFARVVLEISSLSKLQRGEVLITSMTTPDFVVAMKRAGAIVTDEGGLSCHAAIVSRELGIPCVIGTKIATQVLKDGDMVEVDAQKGIVRKLT